MTTKSWFISPFTKSLPDFTCIGETASHQDQGGIDIIDDALLKVRHTTIPKMTQIHIHFEHSFAFEEGLLPMISLYHIHT